MSETQQWPNEFDIRVRVSHENEYLWKAEMDSEIIIGFGDTAQEALYDMSVKMTNMLAAHNAGIQL